MPLPGGTLFDGVVAIGISRGGGRAVKSDGSVWAWGLNDFGQLGTGDTVSPYSTIPVLVPGVVAPVALGGGVYHNLSVDLAAPYDWSGVQPPVIVTGTPVFKKGSTVQLKFKLTGASAGIADGQARFGYAQINSTSPGPVNEPVSNAAGTPGILFQYDAANDVYRYNWRTTGMGMGRYLLRIDLGDGVARSVVVGLK